MISTLPLTACEHTLITGSLVFTGVLAVWPMLVPSWAFVEVLPPAPEITVTVWGTPTMPGESCFDFVTQPLGEWVEVCVDVQNVNEPPAIEGLGQLPPVCLLGQECFFWVRWDDPDVAEGVQSPPAVTVTFAWLSGPICSGQVCFWQGIYRMQDEGEVVVSDGEYEARAGFTFRRPNLVFLPVGPLNPLGVTDCKHFAPRGEAR